MLPKLSITGLASLVMLINFGSVLGQVNIPQLCVDICVPLAQLTRECGVDAFGLSQQQQDLRSVQCLCSQENVQNRFTLRTIAQVCRTCFQIQNLASGRNDTVLLGDPGLTNMVGILANCGSFVGNSTVASSPPVTNSPNQTFTYPFISTVLPFITVNPVTYPPPGSSRSTTSTSLTTLTTVTSSPSTNSTLTTTSTSTSTSISLVTVTSFPTSLTLFTPTSLTLSNSTSLTTSTSTSVITSIFSINSTSVVVVTPPTLTPPAGGVGGGRLGVELGQNRADDLDKEADRLQELSRQLEQQHNEIVKEFYTKLQSMDMSREEMKAILTEFQGKAGDIQETADSIDGSADALDSQSDLLNSYIDFSDQQADAADSQLESLKDTEDDDDEEDDDEDDTDDTDDTDDADDADDDENEDNEEKAQASIAQLQELLDESKEAAFEDREYTDSLNAKLQGLLDELKENIGSRADSFPTQLLALLAATVVGVLMILA